MLFLAFHVDQLPSVLTGAKTVRLGFFSFFRTFFASITNMIEKSFLQMATSTAILVKVVVVHSLVQIAIFSIVLLG